jgi:hypothetical protein
MHFLIIHQCVGALPGFRHVECAVHALIALMDACHAGTQLALYEQTIVEILIELLERSEDRLRLVALLAVAWRHLNFLTVTWKCMH